MAAIAYCRLNKLIELLKSLEGDGMMVRIASSSRLAIGRDPLHPEAVIDLGKEVVVTRNADRNFDANFLRVVS
jgi:hypothetical protein